MYPIIHKKLCAKDANIVALKDVTTHPLKQIDCGALGPLFQNVARVLAPLVLTRPALKQPHVITPHAKHV